MKIEKKILDTVPRCYCASSVTVDGQLYVILASEERDGPCYAYTGTDFSQKEVIWEHAGGTMSLIEIPGTNGEFLAVQHFFPGFQSEGAKIVHGRRDPQKGWQITDMIHLPFLHRFDLFSVGGITYFLGATLCTSKKDREDWSDPGKVYVGVLPQKLGEQMTLTPILEGLCRNHGYCRAKHQGVEAGYITCDSGIYAITPPQTPDAAWKTELLLDRRISDVAVLDIDGDGVDELATIEPFHGNEFHISKKTGEGWEKVYTYPNEMNFAHAVWGGKICGVPTFVVGIRRVDCELFLVQYVDGAYCTTIIEKGVGTSNVAVVNQPDRDILISANHTKNEAAIYFMTPS